MRSRAAAWEVAAPASRCRLLESNARDDDDAGACVADLRQRIEAAQEISTAAFRFDDDDVGSGRAAVRPERGGNAAHLHFHVRLGQAPILSRRLNGGGAFDRFAEGLHGNPWSRRDVLVGCIAVIAIGHCCLPRSLILPWSLSGTTVAVLSPR
jgi:hypothetical protein